MFDFLKWKSFERNKCLNKKTNLFFGDNYYSSETVIEVTTTSKKTNKTNKPETKWHLNPVPCMCL